MEKNPLFLVVDDSLTMRRIIINMLRNLGFNNFVQAEDGQDAMRKLVSEEPDIIITDWNMPRVSGLDFVKAVRNHPDFKDIPILMITTRGMKSDILNAIQVRVDAYIVKPFSPSIVKEKIEQILEKLEPAKEDE